MEEHAVNQTGVELGGGQLAEPRGPGDQLLHWPDTASASGDIAGGDDCLCQTVIPSETEGGCDAQRISRHSIHRRCGCRVRPTDVTTYGNSVVLVKVLSGTQFHGRVVNVVQKFYRNGQRLGACLH